MQRQRKKPEKNNPIQNSFKEYLGINLTRWKTSETETINNWRMKLKKTLRSKVSHVHKLQEVKRYNLILHMDVHMHICWIIFIFTTASGSDNPYPTKEDDENTKSRLLGS
jgi:uncharacterized protein YdgA (DUF945 family)